MRPQHVMFLGLLLVAGLLLSFCLGSLWFDSTDVATTNSLQVFSDYSIFGLFHVPIPNFAFFTHGMKALTTFNFAFFTGEMQLLQWIFVIIIVAGIMWGFFSTIIYLGMGLLNKL